MHETATLHFDLSHLDADQPFTLQVGTARYDLHRHTGASLARARRGNTALALLPDEKVTHHAGPVRLPTGAPVLVRVHAPARADEPLERLVLVSWHLPRHARLSGLRERQGRLGTSRPLPPKMTARMDPTTVAVPDVDVTVDVHDYKTAEDAANALVFCHNELMTTQARPADYILDEVIVWARGMNALANVIQEQATAHETDPSAPDWVSSKPSPGWKPGEPGRAVYVWSAQTLQYLALPVRDALAQSKNDPHLEHQCWTVQPGVARVPMADLSRRGTPRAAEANFTTRDVTPQRGVEHRFAYDPATATATISVKNYFVRWLLVSVDQYGPGGEKVGTTRTLGYASPVDTLMAVPLPADWSDYPFDVDPRASRATVSLGGLGQVPIEWDYDDVGILATGIFCYAIPLLFITLGTAVGEFGSDKAWKKAVTAAAGYILPFFEAGAEGPLAAALTESVSLEDILSALGNFAGSLLVSFLAEKAAAALSELIAEEISQAALETATPFIGWAMYAVGVAADVASMTETSVEVACSPATMRIDIERTMTLAVSVEPDTRHENQWPATATHYSITVTYDDGTARVFDGSMSATTQQGPIDHTFDDLPAGGRITVLACFYSDTDWLAGRGVIGPLPAQPDQGSTLSVHFAITEFLVPLSAATRYSMKEKLVSRDGERVWAAPPEATVPTATVSSLDGSNVGANLGELAGLALNESHSALGYSWKASGQGLPLVGTGTQPYSGQEYVVQAVSDGRTPQSGLTVTDHGRLARPSVAFPPATMARPPADGLFLEADPVADVMWLRAVSLTAGTPFVASPGRSFGRFVGPQDDLEVHPAGFAVALYGATAKLQILRLGPLVVDGEAPTAGIHAGIGTRPGLLSDPVALACATDTIVVLEQTGKAYPYGGLAAFDVRGNPVACFAGTQSTSRLRAEGAAQVVVLDVSVESKGYLYVLKYLDVASGDVPAENYRLDIYDPNGTFLAQTRGLAAARLVVDIWRNVFTLNYEIVTGSGRTEPSVAQWIPSTPSGLADP